MGSLVRQYRQGDDTTNHNAKKKRFLRHLLTTGNVTRSAEACGIERTRLYDYKRSDPLFAAAWEKTLDEAAEMLIDEAQRRAHDGVAEPVFYLGEVCGTMRRYSDSLLMFLIKGRRPQYKDKFDISLTGKDGGPVQIEQLTPEQVHAESDKLAKELGYKVPGEGDGNG